jgi:RNA polymerase sigma-70 factor (ECF subfamily)
MKVSAISLASNPDISDEQIISRVLGGERDIYEVIVRRHNVKLYRVAKGILKDDDEIQDVMQEAYLKAFEKLYQFKGKSSFSTWLTRILINAAFARFNEQKKIHKTDIENVKEENFSVPAEQPVEPTPEMRDNLRLALESSIDSLPATYRSVFMLREITGMSVAETAFCLDISEENVKVRLHRAKEMLKKVLRQGFGEVDLFEFRGKRCDLFTGKVMLRLDQLTR